MQLSPEFLLDAGDFALQAVRLAFAVVEFHRTFDPVAIDGKRLETLPNNVYNLLIPPLKHGAHRMTSITDAAAIDDIEASGDVRTDTFPLIDGENTEFQQNHDTTPW
jgi:hypothetical protein